MSVRAISLLFAVLSLPLSAGAQTLPATRDLSKDASFQTQQAAIEAAAALVPNTGRAKNVILFIGDGMGINSVTSGRILAGQVRGLDGASYVLSFEELPYTAFSKTYSTNDLVTDSANGISAITTGVKTINGGIGVDGNVKGRQCDGVAAARVMTIAEQAKLSGRSAGVVTTSGITDATPAGAYGHTSTRGWRSDADLTPEAVAAGCIDLARQLVQAPASVRLDVAMGGDLQDFTPIAAGGERKDGRDLTAEWKTQKNAAFLTGKAQLDALDTKTSGPVLGLFSKGDLPSPLDKPVDVPGLDEMTAKAIDLLSRNDKGYFLLVESASIDKWHHKNDAHRALHDVDELAKAVSVALSKTDARDTLILITADHSHGLSLSGYAPRDASVEGVSGKGDKAYPLLSYATGPGGEDVHEGDYTAEETEKLGFINPALFGMSSAAHGGEDVPVYARGPQAHLVRSTVESTYLYQVMHRALFGAETSKKK
ncbi:alkaline phosphatase [Asticcacaulis sp. AND118]|uniref:alkaline phosphatase n=1 Tax=Asticcacaulis sp. AND118 TaxID=2840468 RepID=UPI001CFFAAD1|nr:alkaline phosphatase [Asticcacaulis sp. AND118]UDF03734.1 alkaline phosphatase [Asticcacaulis sp. AND118]